MGLLNVFILVLACVVNRAKYFVVRYSPTQRENPERIFSFDRLSLSQVGNHCPWMTVNDRMN